MRWGNEEDDAWAAVSVCKAAPPEMLLPGVIRRTLLHRQYDGCVKFVDVPLKFPARKPDSAHPPQELWLAAAPAGESQRSRTMMRFRMN